MSRTPEGAEKDKVKAFLNKIGAYNYWPVPAGYGRQGIDCVACIFGQFWAIEVKSESGALFARQKQTMEEVRAAKGHAIAGTSREIIFFICHVLGLDPYQHVSRF